MSSGRLFVDCSCGSRSVVIISYNVIYNVKYMYEYNYIQLGRGESGGKVA